VVDLTCQDFLFKELNVVKQKKGKKERKKPLFFVVGELPFRTFLEDFLVRKLPCGKLSYSKTLANFFVRELPCQRTSLSKNILLPQHR